MTTNATHAEPTWQTLKGIEPGDLIASSGDRKSVPLDSDFHPYKGRVDNWGIETEDGAPIRSGGVATKYWVRKLVTTTSTPDSSERSTPQRLEEGKDLDRLAKALTAAKTEEAQAQAMVAMRSAGASYSQMAEAMGVVPMTARSRYLKVTAQ